MKQNKYENDLAEIFKSAVERIKPEKILKTSLSVTNDILTIKTPQSVKEFDLSKFKRIWVTGAGKATASMAKGLESVLGSRIEKGIIAVKYSHTENLSRIELVETGHPVPDENSVKGAKAIASLAEKADSDTLMINLISGGGSAILCLPYSDSNFSLTLEEKQATTRLLLECGASIREINCIRKHISGIKGGRLAKLMYPASCINLILSDVVGDRLDTIASGLTVEDETTYADAYSYFEKYDLLEKIPANVKKLIISGKNGETAETPKKGDSAFTKIENILIGTNHTALLAAEEKARILGYNPLILSSGITGEAREIAKFFSALARDASLYGHPVIKPGCIIAGGETTVTLKGSGKGGRNQEMALSFLNEMAGSPDEYKGIYFLSAGTDGNDGPTEAAGAFASVEILESGNRKELSPASYIARSDSYNYFKSAGGLLITGPTNTNVCDVQLILVV
ncbi:MAG: glycerate kinase [Spirochaetia bacterium]|jgi:hydroxypyruvate reductase|nr:glycerate kinase [Spirochaetia bacterium]